MPKVMLVEDDPTMLSLLQTLLDIEGFEVVQPERPQSALKEVEREQPDLILLDVHLKGSGGDGFDLLRQFREHESLKHIRILMSSGMDLADDCLRRGADDFILKPYMADELLRKVRRLING